MYLRLSTTSSPCALRSLACETRVYFPSGPRIASQDRYRRLLETRHTLSSLCWCDSRVSQRPCSSSVRGFDGDRCHRCSKELRFQPAHCLLLYLPSYAQKINRQQGQVSVSLLKRNYTIISRKSIGSKNTS